MSQTWALILAGALAFTFGANEISHGEVADTVGFGHQHMLDYDGYHCAPHDDEAHREHHYEHMHGAAYQNGTWMEGHGPYHDHAGCYGALEGHAPHEGPHHHGDGQPGGMMGGR